MSATGTGLAKKCAFTERLRFIKPTLPPLNDVLNEYRTAYAQCMITNGTVVQRLESAVEEFLGVGHCVAVSSCTSGLMMVMRALGLSGEVILPSFTFFATGHASVWNGLRPVFADCDPQTWNINPEDVERKINETTSAIVAVHLYGNPCDIQALERIADRHRVALIFDAAHAFGSSRQQRKIGGFGDVEVFSLSPTKLLVAGEGGFVTTEDSVLARTIRAARNYGDLGTYDPELIGLNARMAEFNAALALAGLPLVESKIKRHNQIAQLYTARLRGIPGISFQHVHSEDESTYKDYSVLLDPVVLGISRDRLADRLLEENIETKKYFYPPLHWQTLYRKYDTDAPGTLANTERIASDVLSLPIYEALSEENVATVADTLRAICAR
jgi:dTDP-4-amino-4,6-dideoxygalactose transaminase